MPRFWEVDVVRGFAIILMIFFHICFDLSFFDVLELNVDSGFLWFIARFCVSLFLIVVGISMVLSFNAGWSRSKFFIRGFKIFLLGIIISLVTLVLFPDEFIIFGILHLIGFSLMVSYSLLKLRNLSLFFAFAVLFVSVCFTLIPSGNTFLIPFGLPPVSFLSLDYEPIFPWYSLVLMGIVLGNDLYKGKKRTFSLPDYSEKPYFRFLRFLGRNSLKIYLIHQPVIVALIFLFKFII